MMITAEQDNVSVVAGTNLPMLIDIVMARTEDSTVEDLVAEAVEVGKEGVCHMSLDASAAWTTTRTSRPSFSPGERHE